jgi:hypothetical protein
VFWSFWNAIESRHLLAYSHTAKVRNWMPCWDACSLLPMNPFKMQFNYSGWCGDAYMRADRGRNTRLYSDAPFKMNEATVACFRTDTNNFSKIYHKCDYR